MLQACVKRAAFVHALLLKVQPAACAQCCAPATRRRCADHPHQCAAPNHSAPTGPTDPGRRRRRRHGPSRPDSVTNTRHPALGGIDAQYNRGEFYPGVCDFCFELSNARSAPEPVAVPNSEGRRSLHSLSQLDDDDKVVKTFRECGTRRKVEWGVAPDRVLYGSAHEWVFQDFKGWQKVPQLPDFSGAVPFV